MVAAAQASHHRSFNRRRRVRQKIHAPAYASFSAAAAGEMLDLYEILDISELGLSIQCPAPMEVDRQVELCLDLAESEQQILATATVIWSDSGGRVGLGLSPLPDSTLQRLRQWLFLNAMAGAANAAATSGASPITAREYPELRPSHSDRLAVVSAVQREAESLGSDLKAILSLVVSRSHSLLRASGAAIALAEKDAPGVMICRASVGLSAPPVGAALHVGSGFSGECVRTGKLMRCDDTGSDQRVDPEICRALEIGSMLAAPIGTNGSSVGLIEVFSPRAGTFTEGDAAILQRFADIVLGAVKRDSENHVVRPTAVPPAASPDSKPASANPLSILFADPVAEQSDADASKEKEPVDPDNVGGIRLPRAHLYLLISVAAVIALTLGFIFAPYIEPYVQPWIQAAFSRKHASEQTVLASSQAPTDAARNSSTGLSIDSANLDQLRDLAQQGDPAAADRLGRLYAEGDEKLGVHPDDSEAARWFTSAAEHGSVSAQYKLGLLYWGGHHGLPKDANKAYFWTVLARAGGQEGSKDLAAFLSNGMTRAQAAAIEQQAEIWYQQHEVQAKPTAGH